MENVFCHFCQFFNNILYFWPRDLNIRIQKIIFASTRNSGSPLLGCKLQFPISIFLIYCIIFEVILTSVNQFQWGQSENHPKVTWGSYEGDLKFIWGSFEGHLRVILRVIWVSYKGHVWVRVILGSLGGILGSVGIIWGSSGDHFGIIGTPWFVLVV